MNPLHKFPVPLPVSVPPALPVSLKDYINLQEQASSLLMDLRENPDIPVLHNGL